MERGVLQPPIHLTRIRTGDQTVQDSLDRLEKKLKVPKEETERASTFGL